MKNKYFLTTLSLLIIAAGLIMIYHALRRPVTISMDGQIIIIPSRSFTVKGALNKAGIITKPGDIIFPGVNKWLGLHPAISIKSGKTVRVWDPRSGLSAGFVTTETLPGNMLQQAGVLLYPGDKIRWNGALISADKPLPGFDSFVLQLQPALKINLTRDGIQGAFYSSAASVGQALWQNGIIFNKSDQLDPPAEQHLSENMSITLSSAKPVKIKLAEQIINALSSANTTADVLLDAGITLQGLDYSIPDESEALPENRTIQVVRVSEEILFQQTTLPFETEYIQDAEVGLEQESILQTGESGIKISSQRIRYENGQESTRGEAKEWIARQPVNAKIGYGAKITPYSLETPDGVIEYYRAVSVYATSYSPCRSGTDTCHSGTSLGLPVKKGVIGVTYAWFLLLGGHEVYVPGYGRAVIADVGHGIDGKHWIDLGYSDDDYTHWSQDTTLYFLTPAPPDVPWILP